MTQSIDGGATPPDVTVVVIGFNDAARLPRAIRSVQRQTLRNLEIVVVDDGSTDATGAVVHELAVDDPRIRHERLEQNSGGCSAPRNRGLELARAPWVMFCDSDDEYERHACKNLLLAAERLDADVVCGAAERIVAGDDQERRWRPEVHEVETVADGISGFPELLYDTISVNKIYRRSMLGENGIRFPEGLLFEDQLFTIEAFAAARRVVAIPEVVYQWHVDRQAEDLSITQRRNEVRNVEDRIEINRRIDRFLTERGLVDVQRIKDAKFLRHDLYLYLSSMLELDDAPARAIMDRLVPYLVSLDLTRAWELRPLLRVAVYHLLIGDLDGVRAAMRFVKWASVVQVPIEVDDGRDRWGCSHLRGGPAVAGIPAADWLDVTALHIPLIPVTQRRYLHLLDSLTVTGAEIVASGRSFDYDGQLASASRLELRLSLGGDWSALSVPAQWTGVEEAPEGGRVRSWQARGLVTLQSVPTAARPLGARDRGGAALAVESAGAVNVTTLRSPLAGMPGARVRFPGRTSRSGPDTVEFGPQTTGPYGSGAVGWRAMRTAPDRRRRAERQARRRRTRWWKRYREYVDLVNRDLVTPLLQRLGTFLPGRPLAILEAEAGRAATGNVAALGAALGELQPKVRQVWVVRSPTLVVPAGTATVQRLSPRHQWLASRARLWIDDGTSPLSLRKASGTVATMVGSGVPVHRLGLDDPATLLARGSVQDIGRRARRTDLVVTASRFDTEVRRRAWDYAGIVVEAGIVRNDPVVRRRAEGSDAIRILREQLDLPVDRRVVLYLPTRRRLDRDADESLIDVDGWAQTVGERAYLVLRPHPLEELRISTRLRFAARAWDGDDLELLLAACDLVVSDYSSLIGDAVAAGLPVIAYQPDRDLYVSRTRGLYAGSGAAGPTVTTMEALLREVGAWLDDADGWWARHGAEHEAFAADRCGPRDGRAGARAVAGLVEKVR